MHLSDVFHLQIILFVLISGLYVLVLILILELFNAFVRILRFFEEVDMYEIYCKLRNCRGLKDADVARGTGITKSTFSDWKNGRSSPKDEKLLKIADFFGVSLDYLRTGKEKEGEKYYINDETAAIAQEKLYTIEDIYTLPDGERAELIDGQIYYMAPPRRMHQKLVSGLTHLIVQHIKTKNSSCEVYPAPFAVFLNADENTYVEPDVSVICDKSKLDDRGCNGAPDLILEIVSPSTQRMDYGVKLFKYRSAGVREYWIINPMTNTVNVYDLEQEKETGQHGFDNPIPVCIFPDLEICIAELLK